LGGLLKRVRLLAATIAVDAASALSLEAKIPPIAVDTGMGGAYKRGSLKSGSKPSVTGALFDIVSLGRDARTAALSAPYVSRID
jgi:hypothetical protein